MKDERLTLLAQSAADLPALLALLQDATVRVADVGFDRRGKRLRFTASNFFARVIQHECDHLIATVFLDRMQGLGTLTFLDEFGRYWAPQEEAE
jgi:hypothetical protein